MLPLPTRRAALICLTLAGAVGGASAQSWPTKPVTLVQGFNAGGNADTIARIVAEGLSRELGQPVVVEARTGAGGNLASGQVARAAADGHTLILLTGGHAVSAAVYKKLPFEPVSDFHWVGLVTTFPFVIATRADGPIKSLPDLIATAQKQPGTISFSSVGVGSTQHLAGELLQSMAKVKLNHIPYRGGTAPLQDVIGGQVDVLFDSVTVARAQAQAGRLRVLAVTSTDRNPQLPDAEPAAKTVPGFEVLSWTALAAPKDLPAPVADRLADALRKALAQPEVRQKLALTGGVPDSGTSSADTRRFVGEQVDKWKRVVNDANIERQ
jgi:tripartite-type tricarboxylate transporter receptor subunit TctC